MHLLVPIAMVCTAARADGQGRTPPAPHDVVVLAAGDIARCDGQHDEATAALLDRLPGEVLALGDQAYPAATAEDYRRCYGPSWGRHRERTHPTPGNHEYFQRGAIPYFDYFGRTAGPRGKGWYSFDLGAWHVVSLNSEFSTHAGSEQERWLRDDLRRHRNRCVLAFWHRARFSSGEHGNTREVAPLWRALHDAGADVVVQAHDHDYERFDPLNANGRPDPNGLRSFVVGTGGGEFRNFRRPVRGSAVRIDHEPGVLRLTLRAISYAWEFVPVSGSPKDHGEATCR
jgi:alkaline phosphatase